MARRLPQLQRLGSMLIGLVFTTGVLALAFVNPSFLQSLDRIASDMRFQIRGERRPGPEVVIAAIDEKSLDQIGRWPWPYTVQAQLVDRLTAYGAAVIGYDVIFSESDASAGVNLQAIYDKLTAGGLLAANPEVAAFLEQRLAATDHDRVFADALQRSARTVLGYFFHWDYQTTAHLDHMEIEKSLMNIRNSKYNAVIKRPDTNLHDLPLPSAWAVESNIAVLSQAAWGSGYFNNNADADGGIRHYPLIVKYRDKVEIPGEQDYLFAPLGVRMLERYLSGQVAGRDIRGQTRFRIGTEGVERVEINGTQNYAIPTDKHGELLINYLGRGETFPFYSAADILYENREAAPAEAFYNKLVLVGATAQGLKDLKVTPFDSLFPGVEVHATVIDNILRGDFLVTPEWSDLYTFGSVLGLGLFLTLFLPRAHPIWGTFLMLLLLAAQVVGNYALFVTYGWWLNLIYPLLVTLIVPAGITIQTLAVERQAKNYLRRVFGVYIPSQLLEQMEPAQVEPELGGRSGVHTAYFTDIASFSSFSEVLSATALVELLLEYLTVMTDILQGEEGTLDKYEGDAIVAFFGAPVPLPDHALRAVRTALGMQAALQQLREKWRAEGEKWPALVHNMRMRIGMNSGEFVTGNMGSQQRMNYTMMGDVVNTAARLEASAKQYGIYIHCTVETLQMAGEDLFEWRLIDRVRVMGRSQAVETVEIMAYKGQLSPELEQMRALYHQGVDLYRHQQWDEASAKFTESAKLEEQFPSRPTTPSQMYMERCEFFKANPPGAEWDGSWSLTSK